MSLRRSGPVPERPPDPTHIAVQMRVAISLANLVGAIAVFTFLRLALDPPGSRFAPGPELDLATFLIVVLSLGLLGNVTGHMLLRPVRRWIDEGRPPTDRERRFALTQPWFQAANALALWVLAAVVYPVGAVAIYGHTASFAGHMAEAIVFGGLTTAALSYFICERVMRPVFALAIAGSPPDRSFDPRVRRRLLVAWALGSGIPLLGLAVAPSIIQTNRWEFAVVGLAVIGLVMGAGMTALVSHALTDRLEAVRDGLARVESGDLDTAVVVDDAGEIGQLQAGFNRMVEGLRERQRLRDLFGRQVGEQVAELAIERGVDLGGHQQEAAVLFVDLIGSTAMAQDRPPVDVVRHLSGFFGCVVEVVNDEQGYVSRFEGDGALCVWGAPVPVDDAASRALVAARRLATVLRDHGYAAGVGVSAGIVVAGNVGTPERYEWTIIGDPVNEAARLTDESKHTPARVLASEAVVSRAGMEAVHWQAGGEVQLRGRAQPTATFVPAPIVVSQPGRA